MGTTELWSTALAGLAEHGWYGRVVAVERLAEAAQRVGGMLASGGLPAETAGHLADETAFDLPPAVSRPRSVVIAATARPLTQATLLIDGAERTVPVPPHYAGYYTVPLELPRHLAAALASYGYKVAGCSPPLKTLATGAGLALYGRNNVTFVPGLGSYLLLAACVSDAPPPEDDGWGEPQPLDRCEGCSACRRACPTGAIAADRFLLHTELCLTAVNESEEPFPEWVQPQWHTCAVGCLRCQQVCPENAAVELVVQAAEVFDERESAAILAADVTALGPVTRGKLARCGLDYSATLIARNLRALIGG